MSGTAVPRGAISGRATWGDAALLVTISSIGPFAANTYVPGFHAIAESLGTDLVAVQQSLSLYLIVFAVASLFVGALSDALGRKPVIVGGMLLFVVSSVAAMMSTSIEWLYACRVLQGVAASVGPVVTQAVVRDRWSGENAARVLALMTVLFGLAPAAAPIIGGWITVHFGWRGIFLFLAVLNLTLAALAHFRLPETHPKENRRAFSVVGTAAPYGQAVRHPAFMAGVIGHGFTFMGGIVYSAGAADFVINIMGMGVDDFGWLVVPLIVCTMLGGWAGPRLLRRLGPWPLLAWGISVMTAAGLVGIALDWEGAPGYPWLLVCPMIYHFNMAVVRPVMNVMNLDYFPKNRGMAASIQQFFQTMGFAVASAVLVPIVLGEAWRYSAVMAGAAVLTGLLWIVVKRRREAAVDAE